MPEENQIQMSQVSTPVGDETRNKLASLRQFRTETKLRKAQQNQDDMFSTSNNLFDQSLSVRDPDLARKYHMASQSSAIAPMIKDYAQRNYEAWLWDDWSDLTTTQDIMTEYFRVNPDDETYNKIMDFVQSDGDPEDFWVEMWWIEKNGWDKVWDRVKWVWKNFLSFYETWGDAVANLINGSLDEIESWFKDVDYTMSAKENFARMKYGTNYYGLTPEQKAEADYEVSTQEGYNTYKPTPQRAISKWAEAWLDAFFTVAAPWMKAAFSASWETPVLEYVNQWLGVVTEFGGYLINALPLLYQYKMSLQTEQERRERDQFVGSFWLMKVLQKRSGRDKWTTKDTILSEIDPVTMVKEFQKRVVDAPSDIKGLLNKWKSTTKQTAPKAPSLDELRTNNKWLKLEADNIVRRVIKGNKKADNIARERISRWLAQLTPEESTSYRTASEALAKKGKAQWLKIDNLLKKDTKTYWREDVMLKETNKVTWKETQTDVFERMLDALRKNNENWPNERGTYEYYREKLINWELTLKELNDIDRAFNREFSDKMYTEAWQEKAGLNAEDARRLRSWWKKVIRTLWDETGIEGLEYENLEKLDSEYADLIDAYDYINEFVEGKANYDATRHAKTEGEQLGEAAWQLYDAANAARRLDIRGMKNAFERWTPESATFEELETEFPSNVQRLWELNKTIWDNSSSIKKLERLDFSTEWEGFSKLRSKNADYMIVSAENPMWKSAPAEVNAAKTQAFRDFLDENGIQWREQKWMYDNPENSQIIAIDNPRQRIIIDERLEANAPQNENIIVKWWEAYRYDPRTKKAYKVDLNKADVDLPAETDNYYSEIDWRKYQIPLWRPEDIKVSKKDFLDVYNN